MTLPPLDTGAVNATLAYILPPVATGLVGAPGTVLGVTAVDTIDATELPTALVATTVNVYSVPLVKLVTVSDKPVPVEVRPPGEEVTVYPVMVLPPVETGAVKVTVA